MENLHKALSFGGILAEEQILQITDRFEPRQLKAGDHFLLPGKKSHEIGFIDEGIIRVYLENDAQEEATKYFLRRHQFMMDIESFYNNTPTDTGMQAMTPCRVLVIHRSAWNQLNQAIPKLFILTKILTEAALLSKIKDSDFLHFGTAKQKYQEFVKRYPDLALLVPQHYIAAYLQITPQSLSRIRKMEAGK